MARPPDSNHAHKDVEYLWEQHHEVLRLLVKGYKPRQISEMTGLTETFICRLRNSPIAKERLEILGAERDAITVAMVKRIAELQPKALSVLERVLNGETNATIDLEVRTAQDMLSRGGNAPVQRMVADVRHGLDEETLNAIKERAEQARTLMGGGGETDKDNGGNGKHAVDATFAIVKSESEEKEAI